METSSPTACMLLINDIHLSKENIPAFHKNWDEALAVCKENKIKTIVIGGDLWQSRAGQTLNVLMAAREAIIKASSLGIYVIIESGNHDKVDQESILSYNHIFSEYPNVDVVNDYEGYDVSENTILWLISYFPENGSFQDKLQAVVEKLPAEKNNILYCHEGINGALSTPSDKELPANIFEPFDKVLVGHYHNRTKLNNIEYIGSSRQHNFGEDEFKGYTILYADGSTKFVQNQANERYQTIELNADNLKNAKELIQTANTSGTKLRVKISCSSEEAATLDKSALIELGASKIEVNTFESTNYAKAQDLSTKFNKDGLKSEYTRFCIQKEIENIEMGLKYLDKIS